MAAEEDADTLKLYWDHFFKAETGTYEKSTWLDLFLAEFLIRLNKGDNPRDLIKFCPVSGVVTLVGCELLCGIHRVTSSINTHYAPLQHLDTANNTTDDNAADNKSEECSSKPASLFSRANAQSSAEILRKYLLGGVAWKCLVLLKALGVEGLSCCRQLSSVLVWLFGELGAAPATPAAAPTAAAAALAAPLQAPRPPMHELFSNRIWSKQKSVSCQSSKVNSVASSERNIGPGRSRYNGQVKLENDKSRKWSAVDSEQSTESGDSNDDLQVLNRSMTIKVCSANDDFEYFNSPLRSSNEFPNDTLYSDPYYTPRKSKPKADDYMNEKHKEIINSEISTFEFTLIIIDLLQELCKAESSLSGSEGSQISMQCINFALKNLCTLQFGSLPVQSLAYEALELSKIKVALTELLMVSLNQVLVHSDLCAKLINNGILPMLLRILEDVICKSSVKYNIKGECQNRAKDAEKPNETESRCLLEFVFGIAYSITAFFHCLLMQCRSVEKLREFTDQFKLYGECLKGGLLKECTELMVRIPGADREESAAAARKLTEAIGKLIGGMKRVRSEVIHSAACGRARHKACRARVAAGAHHHHAALGAARPGALPPAPPACAVAALYGSLAALLPDERLAALAPRLLRVLLRCGVCCCFPPTLLMESVVRLMLTQADLAAPCLRLLERTVYGELGASVLVPKVTDQLPCSICEPGDDARDPGRKYCSYGVSPMERKSVWSFLIHYNSLLQLDNHNNVLHATVNHLLKVTPKCRMEMKYELLFSVIYPTFIVSKHRYTIKLDEAAYFLTVSCLNIFASLLNTVSFAEQFIQKGGLSYVLELISLPEFSNQCCAILEIAITVEIFKLMKENAELTYFREINSLASVQMLFKSLSEMTEKCYKIYKLKLPEDKFEELCDVNEEREMLAFINHPVSSPTRKSSMPILIKNAFIPNENGDADSQKDHVEVLKNVLTFWKSCAGLCLYSPMFREYVVSESVFLDSYALLKLILHYLCNCECPPAEARVLIKIMEALLTVQFAVSEETSERSKATSCSVVRAALSARACGGLRALCDALVGVAVAPSRRHAMPCAAPAKAPPLACAAGASSAEGSSSEDSVAGPYASERSEPRDPPDDGYEADVEVGKLELSSYKTRKLSKAMSTYSNVSDGYKELASMECPPYSKNGEIAHPELCVIVIDILTQLIDKLLSEESAGESRAELERVCCGLARACAARLAAGGAPALLLARLLARGAPAARLLACDDKHLAELQRSVLELVQAVGGARLAARELAALLQLFAAERPPRAALLRALARLLPAPHAPAAHTPDYYLSFPMPVSEDCDENEKNGVMSNHVDDTDARISWNGHLGAESARGVAAAAARVDAAWAPWLQGFALLLWLRATPARRTKETGEWQEGGPEAEAAGAGRPLHVLSVGHDSLMFELWTHPDTGEVSVRLSRPEGGGARALGEARAAALAPRRWTCLALNVAELVHKRRIHIQVTVYVNGRHCETLSIPLQGILVRKPAPTNVYIGDVGAGAGTGAGAGAGGGYQLAGARVLRAPALGAAAALHLAAHGPDQPCQFQCESPNFSSIITPELLDMDIDWDQVLELPEAALRELQAAALLSLAPHAPAHLVLHAPPAAAHNVFGGRIAGGGGAPEAVRLRWRAAPRPAAPTALAPALLDLGGPDLLLYLFARIIELEGTAEEQAGALDVLLRACAGDARLHARLLADTLELLPPLLAAHTCRVTHHLLKVILDEAFSGPLITINGGTVMLLANTDCVLLEPELLVLLMRCWRQFDNDVIIEWEVVSEGAEEEAEGGAGRGSAWALALAALRAALRPAHPRRAFSRRRAARAQLLRHLLQACKERFLNSECPPLDAATSRSLVELVRALAGAPPPLRAVALLCDFLLLMHQASDTFVTHSRANFYFLLTADTPETSDFNILALLSKRKQSADKWKTYDNNDNANVNADKSSASSVSTEDATIGSSLNDLTDAETNHEAENEKTDFDTSVESTKQMKSLINKQIKESRNASTISVNSVNSEISNDGGAGGGAGGGGDDPLTEYVVVDVEEVSHTTVDVYTSGIYQQRRVRAGAEPGWSACEGLLLLLRDAVLELPDDVLAQAAGGALRAERLLVLAQHRAAGVRAAVVRATAALQARAPAALAAALGGCFYVHLANQIALYPGSWELVTACAALLTKCDVPLEDQLDEDIWMDVGEDVAVRSPPLLALLPTCLDNVPLAHHIIAILHKLIDKSSAKALAEVALAEVCVRALRALAAAAGAAAGAADLRAALAALLAHLARAPAATPQMVVDIHHMLTYVEQSSAESSVQRVARDAQIALYCAQLDHLEERLRDTYTSQTKTNYFTNVLSSAMESSLAGGGGRGGRAARGGRAERAELSARHADTLARAVAFLLTLSPRQDLQPEADFFERIFNTLLMGVCGPSRGKWWSAGAAECAGALHAAFWWALAPAPGARALQPRLLRALYRAPREVLRHLTPRDPSASRKLSVYLTCAVQAAHSAAVLQPAHALELCVTDWARDWAVRAQAPQPDRLPPAALPAEAARLLAADERRAARSRAAIGKSVFSREAQCARACEAAMAATRRVVETQNAERKAFLEHLRAALARHAAAAQRAARRLAAHTHERAVWWSPRGQPAAWALDSTEGPGRVRVRLRRAHLRIPARCFQPKYRYKAESAKEPGPLSSVLGGSERRGGVAARLQLHETVACMARVVHVTVASETPGELLLTDRCIHFVPEESAAAGAAAGADAEAGALCWALGAVRGAATRRWCLQERALELFLHSGRAHLLAFADADERAAFLKHLARHHPPERSEPDALADAMAQWRNGTITNWEYLMTLNGLAGRSYNDLMQYPVLPFVLADYTSRILDLTDPATFRDLSKPMAVQNKNREQHYIKTYNDLKAARREGCSPLLSRQPHHYASLYSNSGGVLHYLVRVPPFTELFLNYQDNNFDMPDRTFHSLATTWRLITNDSPTDVKELIPELFYLPEMFYNNEGLELGVRQCGARVDGVSLARWAADARLFTLLHRHALEAPHVAERLPLWIDLVFGCKQTGQAAIDAINVFPACTYYGFDPTALEDELDRTAAAAMVRTYGQAPRQLLRAPHPQRLADLLHRPDDSVPVWDGVRGARWGRYCGSPGAPAAAPAARRAAAAPAALQPLPHARAAALAAPHTALVPLHEESVPMGSSKGAPASEAYGVLSWAHADDMLRLRRRRDLPPDVLMHVPPAHQITVVAPWCAGGSRRWGAFLGHASGRVTALRVRAGAGAAPPAARTRLLHAHVARVADVAVCAPASLLVTASDDGIVVIWDLNELSYIRTLPNRGMLPVRRVAVSETLSDVATVHSLTAPPPSPPSALEPPPALAPPPAHCNGDSDIESDSYEKDAAHKYKSLIRVHTVNASFVGSVKVSELVTSICYSNAPEGVSVNCIAAGLDTGAIRLYSSWDLRPVTVIPPPGRSPGPAALSVAYSTDSQVLFASYADGAAVAWESAEAGARAAAPRLLPAHALL
ncbi:lysosomal-trafficking regulator [Epargyreus clarus]|uniref:lysosomal-trafficking regulator n=1 Tax=Epargyreus clarus TaxID=520877 RepID=UPI003C2C86A4